jgi:hypothetical protein
LRLRFRETLVKLHRLDQKASRKRGQGLRRQPKKQENEGET